ncbi:K(+)-transporting ATPase subunit C [Dinghuibacter silviterrae]|uniref:Potassium-transporting ATPase KdpC subunit n=1 Tax=Dinghuibacter silviterrae TaxID=1539049 RepID=A0A4R8DQL9_9BACT|nr:K(+)-transporting ATPase subunit C [Dinghuibacter silviterrae]TDX00450.1 K+-transporting ATPase ATPase C chain [Dinghuibacter silviterrae]
MKKYILPALKLTLSLIILCAVIYPLFIAAIGRLTPGHGRGKTVTANGKVVGYALLGQKFTDDKYFWSRPSAVAYNAAGSGGSNKGPSNPDYIKDVQAHIDTFLVHNPGVDKAQIPAELVTYSGSGLDPDLSPAAALIQVKRVASVRHLPEAAVHALVESHVKGPFLGLFGPSTVNVLSLNLALDTLKP